MDLRFLHAAAQKCLSALINAHKNPLSTTISHQVIGPHSLVLLTLTGAAPTRYDSLADAS